MGKSSPKDGDRGSQSRPVQRHGDRHTSSKERACERVVNNHADFDVTRALFLRKTAERKRSRLGKYETVVDCLQKCTAAPRKLIVPVQLLARKARLYVITR